MVFLCNICGRNNTIDVLQQEESSCTGCGSNVRLRALMHLLSMELFGDGFILPDFPRLSGIKGLGLSDQASYAEPLAEKFDYTNTYYDREPRFDITEAHPDRYGTYDFILSSDVFEHIEAPVERAFDEALAVDGRAIVDEDPKAGPEAVDERATEPVGIEAAGEAIRVRVDVAHGATGYLEPVQGRGERQPAGHGEPETGDAHDRQV
jgi:hypothetical protein